MAMSRVPRREAPGRPGNRRPQPRAGEGEAKTSAHLAPLRRARAAGLHASLVRKTLAGAVAAKLGEVTGLSRCLMSFRHAFFEKCRVEFKVKARGRPKAPAISVSGVLNGTSRQVRGPLLLAGLDCPPLSASAFSAMRGRASGVGSTPSLLPAEDGGYAPAGQRPIASPFSVGIEWGTECVMEETASSAVCRCAQMVGARHSLGCRPARKIWRGSWSG